MTPQEWIEKSKKPIWADTPFDGNAELRKAAEWIAECEKWDEGEQLLNEKALAQSQIEHRRSSMQIAPTLPMGVEDWMMLVARKQGRDENADEIAQLKEQLSQAKEERVVVPEWSVNDFALSCVAPGSYIDGDLRAIFRNAEAGYRLAASRAHSVPASRVLKDGEVAVDAAELAALRKFADGWSEFRSQFDDIQYHHSGMGCGIEDRGIHDRCAACEHGWECAMERVAERFPEIDTLDALRAQGKEGAT